MLFPRCQHFVRFFMIILIFPSFDRDIPVRIELCSQTLFCSATFFSSERFCGRILRGDPFYPLLYTTFCPTSKISVKNFSCLPDRSDDPFGLLPVPRFLLLFGFLRAIYAVFPIVFLAKNQKMYSRIQNYTLSIYCGPSLYPTTRYCGLRENF